MRWATSLSAALAIRESLSGGMLHLVAVQKSGLGTEVDAAKSDQAYHPISMV
jgi:hypothetical protein